MIIAAAKTGMYGKDIDTENEKSINEYYDYLDGFIKELDEKYGFNSDDEEDDDTEEVVQILLPAVIENPKKNDKSKGVVDVDFVEVEEKPETTNDTKPEQKPKKQESPKKEESKKDDSKESKKDKEKKTENKSIKIKVEEKPETTNDTKPEQKPKKQESPKKEESKKDDSKESKKDKVDDTKISPVLSNLKVGNDSVCVNLSALVPGILHNPKTDAVTITRQKMTSAVIPFPGDRYHDDVVEEATKDTLIDPNDNDNHYKETVITNNFIIRKNMPEVSDFIQIANDCKYDVVCSYELFTMTNIGNRAPMVKAYLVNRRTKAIERCFIINNTIFGRTCVYMVPVDQNVDIIERSINMFNIDKMPFTNMAFQLSNWVDIQKHKDIVRHMIKSGKYSEAQKSIVLNKIPKIFRVVENNVGFDDRVDLTKLSQIPMMAIDSKYDQLLTNIGRCVFDPRVPLSRYHIRHIENENNFSITNIVNETFSYIDSAINENMYINSINNPVTILYTNGEISMYDLNGNILF